MTYLLILLAVAALLAVVAHLFQGKDSDNDTIEAAPSCDTCNGETKKCEQDCMLEAATKPIEYFDDEDLDQFIGRPADQYTDAETELFREVLYTMKEQEVAEWNRSLILRNINLPLQLRDEMIMMISEG